ncbi:MAG: hypothetical protein QXI89_02030 [Candidatus Anstonellales archaeon]
MITKFYDLLFIATFHEEEEIRRDALLRAMEIAEQQRFVEELVNIATGNNVITNKFICSKIGIDENIVYKVRKECAIQSIKLARQDGNIQALEKIIVSKDIEEELRIAAIDAFHKILSNIIKKNKESGDWLNILKLLEHLMSKSLLDDSIREKFQGTARSIAKNLVIKLDEENGGFARSRQMPSRNK